MVDCVVALNAALLVNAAILVMAGAVFFKRNIVVTEIQQAHLLLAPLLAEHVDASHVRNHWACEACGHTFRKSFKFEALDAELAA